MAERRLARGQRLVIATHNAGKLAEIGALLAPYGIETIGAGALGLPEPDETGETFAANATIKAVAAAKASGLPALADDSGFCIAALRGGPGVRTADAAMLPGGGRDYAVGMARVRANCGEPDDVGAWFVCVLALAWPDGEVEVFEGRVDGAWVWPPRGANGFGFDPMFVPAGHVETFGEMDPATKHAISHRAAAFALFEAKAL
ncbi:non-canonical purine NTP pyrophosphatase [Elioraea sp.]|uniref:non-canonical purine NTP pyrophosphatase n=1 Tax=Elioraea sp. TaxID=2185103 RepID=UPI0025BF74DE|nr:non-canonical purine NTP pyrophosphatase [Elioraea sp.]